MRPVKGPCDGEAKQVVVVSGRMRLWNGHLLDAITEGPGLPVTSTNLHKLRRATNVNRTMGRTGELWTDPEIEGR